jgi:hypothetical protein
LDTHFWRRNVSYLLDIDPEPLMNWTIFLHTLEPLLVCHSLPGLIGGMLRWLYLLHKGRLKGKRLWQKALSDTLGGLLVGTILGPFLAGFTSIPAESFSLLNALRSLPAWLTVRWFVSAAIGFSWMAALEAIGEKITALVREALQKISKIIRRKP